MGSLRRRVAARRRERWVLTILVVLWEEKGTETLWSAVKGEEGRRTFLHGTGGLTYACGR